MSKFFITSFIVASLTLTLFGSCVSTNDEGEIALSQECTWYGSAECEAACETTDFNVACQGECNANIDLPSCKAKCDAACQTECDADPGSFTCEGHCGGECAAYCKGECAADSDSAKCEGKCESWCKGECTVSCESEPAEFTCKSSCAASCEGSCTAGNVEFDCWLDCDIDPPFDCKGSCDADGFYECDGEFISTGDVKDAIAWIEANMPEVEVYADASGECEGNTCHAEGSCGVNCAVGSTPTGSPLGVLLFLSVLASFIFVRRER